MYVDNIVVYIFIKLRNFKRLQCPRKIFRSSQSQNKTEKSKKNKIINNNNNNKR